VVPLVCPPGVPWLAHLKNLYCQGDFWLEKLSRFAQLDMPFCGGRFVISIDGSFLQGVTLK
jgi:hypothetical protein